MGNTQHLKRHSAPTSWPIKRKNITFIARPNPGSHKQKYVTPMVVVLRDVLKVAQTSKEVKLILHDQDILINTKKITDTNYPIGMFDLLEIKNTKEKYIVLFDTFGKLKLIPVNDNSIYLKITNKNVLSSKKYQLNFMNGFNILVDKKTFDSAKVEDTVLYNLDKKKVLNILNFKSGVYVYIYDGNFKGNIGEVKGFELYKGLTKDIVHVQIDNKLHSTAKDYCYVIGMKKEDLKLFNTK